MAMGLRPAESDGEDEVLSAINTTPLVDVMLVLLIIFLITIPAVVYTMPMQLPKEATQPLLTKPENVALSITKDGDVFWNDRRGPGNAPALQRPETTPGPVPQP